MPKMRLDFIEFGWQTSTSTRLVIFIKFTGFFMNLPLKKNLSLSYVVFLLVSNFLISCSLEAQTPDCSCHMELSINRYIMNHRFGLHALTINVEMHGSPIACDDKITNEIKDFLANYPNQEDYWEIVNKKLVVFLSKLYPTHNQIQATISIEPDYAKPFSRKSICKLSHGEIERQAFEFSILNHPFRDNLACITVGMEYNSDASTNDYVNFFAIKEAIEVFIKENSRSDWPDSLFPEKIAKHLLTCFPSIVTFSIELEIPPHACNLTRYCWKANFSKENLR